MTNLYRVIETDLFERSEGLQVGDIVSVTECDNTPYCLTHVGKIPIKLENLEQVADPESLFVPKEVKHEFTFGQRIALKGSDSFHKRARYFVGYQAEGRLVTTQTDPKFTDKICTYVWRSEQLSAGIEPYVEPIVKVEPIELTVAELSEMLGQPVKVVQ